MHVMPCRTFKLWLTLLSLACVSATFIDSFIETTNEVLYPREDPNLNLPVDLGIDKRSGCICRATKTKKTVVCFGNYECRRFPKVSMKSDVLKVRTTVIQRMLKGNLDDLGFLTVLDIEANYKLTFIEPGIFRNMTKLQHLSISYNTNLRVLHENVFEGLNNLKNLTLVNNGFTNIMQITCTCRPSILASLKSLDISENRFEKILEMSFSPMEGSPLTKLDIKLCSLDFIHQNSFRPLRMLKKLYLGDNEVNATQIGNLFLTMKKDGINLTYIDLSGLGFRKQPPRELLDVVTQTTIKRLNLAHNQFEVISDNTFPRMENIELLDLRKVQAIDIGPFSFDPSKFPNLKILLLGGNNLPGLHQKHLSNQLLLLDLSCNIGNHANPVYFEIDRDTFIQSTELRVLNLAYNRIKSLFYYSFSGLQKLEVMNLENGTIYFIGDGTFKPTKSLKFLNLGNNPLTNNQNLTYAQFEGLHQLKVLILKNCGIKRLNDEDNIFESMPNLTQLILRNNQLLYVTPELLKPLKFLQVLDLSENLLISWWRPLFLSSGVRPTQLLLTNNKISQFSVGMIQDLNYLLEGRSNIEIDMINNVFICDCSAMYSTYLWLEVNGTGTLKNFFANSNFLCSSPDLWEDRRVADYLLSLKTVNCLMYVNFSNAMIIVWTAPSLITICAILLVLISAYKYRIYIRYWLFLAKIAIGRKFIRREWKAENMIKKGYRYDAFISYCFEDRDFVLDMIDNLEKLPPHLKLCVSERDFEAGSFISEAILAGINESKYVILLISNHFAKSHWCRWETQLAEYHRLFLEDGSSYDPLVLVKLEEVNKKYLTPTLKYLLKTKIYLTWNENNSEEFWKKLRTVLGKKT